MLEAMADRGVDVSACRVVADRPTGASVILGNGADRAILTAIGTIADVARRRRAAGTPRAGPPRPRGELLPPAGAGGRAARRCSGRRTPPARRPASTPTGMRRERGTAGSPRPPPRPTSCCPTPSRSAADGLEDVAAAARALASMGGGGPRTVAVKCGADGALGDRARRRDREPGRRDRRRRRRRDRCRRLVRRRLPRGLARRPVARRARSGWASRAGRCRRARRVARTASRPGPRPRPRSRRCRRAVSGATGALADPARRRRRAQRRRRQDGVGRPPRRRARSIGRSSDPWSPAARRRTSSARRATWASTARSSRSSVATPARGIGRGSRSARSACSKSPVDGETRTCLSILDEIDRRADRALRGRRAARRRRLVATSRTRSGRRSAGTATTWWWCSPAACRRVHRSTGTRGSPPIAAEAGRAGGRRQRGRSRSPLPSAEQPWLVKVNAAEAESRHRDERADRAARHGRRGGAARARGRDGHRDPGGPRRLPRDRRRRVGAGQPARRPAAVRGRSAAATRSSPGSSSAARGACRTARPSGSPVRPAPPTPGSRARASSTRRTSSGRPRDRGRRVASGPEDAGRANGQSSYELSVTSIGVAEAPDTFFGWDDSLDARMAAAIARPGRGHPRPPELRRVGRSSGRAARSSRSRRSSTGSRSMSPRPRPSTAIGPTRA